MRAHGLLVLLAATAALRAAAVEAKDACTLLVAADLKSVQGSRLVQKVPSRQPAGTFHLSQCYFRTADHGGSVSLALSDAAVTSEAPRLFWRERFAALESLPAAKKRKLEAPQPVPGLGDEACWIGDPRLGALYVLSGDAFLRISIGGAGNDDERRDRARALAAKALARLAEQDPRTDTPR